MVVNFEFLGEDPIENVITAMNYAVDKVVYFGYFDEIKRQKAKTERFLKKYCGVGKVVFHALSESDLPSVVNTMRKIIEEEKANGGDLYFDITSGESMILVVFGMLSREYKVPIHIYNVEENRLMELDEGAERSISVNVTPRRIELDLDKYIEMYGGCINAGLHEDSKCPDEEGDGEDLDNLISVFSRNKEIWTRFSGFMAKNMNPSLSLKVNESYRSISSTLAESNNSFNSSELLNKILRELYGVGLIRKLIIDDKVYSFTYKNESVRSSIIKGGNILELKVCRDDRDSCDDCRVSVHLDWDGEIHESTGGDVVNEIDVLELRGNVAEFVSCKSGRMGPNQILAALYELETVARKFGGRHARKRLVLANEIGDVYMARAEEMGIRIQFE